MFPSAHDEQARVFRLPNQYRTGVPAGELQDPVRTRRYRVEYRGDRLPVGVLELITAQIHGVDWRRKAGGTEPVRPIKHMYGSKYGTDALALLSCPIQRGLAGRRIVKSYNNFVLHRAPPSSTVRISTPLTVARPVRVQPSLAAANEDLRPLTSAGLLGRHQTRSSDGRRSRGQPPPGTRFVGGCEQRVA
jgi:hypothetical protein